MRDHRPEELRIGHRQLLTDSPKEENECRQAGNHYGDIHLGIGVDGTHYRELNEHHGYGHETGHVKLIDVDIDVGENVHHCIHQAIAMNDSAVMMRKR